MTSGKRDNGFGTHRPHTREIDIGQRVELDNLGADDRGGFWAGMIRLGEGGWHSPSSVSPTNVDGKLVKPLASRAAGGSGGRSGLPSNASFHRALSSGFLSGEDAQTAHEEVMQLEGFLDMLENWDEFERDRE